MARKYKWEVFVDKVIAGMSQRDAYKTTFDCKNMTDSSIDSTASAMLHDTKKYPKISARYLELNEKAKAQDDEKAIADSEEMQRKLTEIIRQITEEEVIVVENTGDFRSEARSIKKTAAIKDIISAINTLGKMQGLFTDKVDVNAEVSPIVIKDDVVE